MCEFCEADDEITIKVKDAEVKFCALHLLHASATLFIANNNGVSDANAADIANNLIRIVMDPSGLLGINKKVKTGTKKDNLLPVLNNNPRLN